jgi:hypothetical protein
VTRIYAENPRSSTASNTFVESGDRYSRALREEDNPVRLRRTSTTQRPVSDVPNAADFNALSAREAWQADRMWKGMSMYDTETGGVATIPQNLATSYYEAVRQHEINAAAAAAANAMHANHATYQTSPHGSSHTSYLVQSPFANQQPTLHNQSSYYAFPVAPTMVYPVSPYAQPSSAASSPIPVPGPYDFPNTYRSYGDAVAFPTSEPDSSPLRNPLPEPPRQSLYSTTSTEVLRQIAAAPSIADSDPATPDYWNVYAGMAPTRA